MRRSPSRAYAATPPPAGRVTGETSHLLQKLNNSLLSASSVHSLGRQWDDRFVFGEIPAYDALNDRFCKFTRLRGLSGTQKRQGPSAIARPAVASTVNAAAIRVVGQLPPLQQRGRQAFAASGASASIPAGHGEQASQSRLDVNFSRAQANIVALWNELDIPGEQRNAFAQKFWSNGATTDATAATNDEIQRLVEERAAAVAVEKCIEVREGFLYLLQELTERYGGHGVDPERAMKELNAIIPPLRNASCDVVEAISLWRTKARAQKPYQWHGVNYLRKMTQDIAAFLAHSRLRQLVEFEVIRNPLLDAGKATPGMPRREALQLQDRLARCSSVLTAELDSAAAASATADASLPDAERAAVAEETSSWLNANVMLAKPSLLSAAAAAVKIQSVYRMWRARRVLLARLCQRDAAIKIQSLARRFIARLELRRRGARTEAARRIQAIQRGVAARSRLRDAMVASRAATRIQAAYRGHMVRRAYRMFRFVARCAVDIQRVFRGYITRKLLDRVIHDHRVRAATVVQRHWRGFCVRRNPLFNPRVVGTVLRIQAWFRGCCGRATARRAYAIRRAAIKIQALWRGVRARMLRADLERAKAESAWTEFLVVGTVAATRIQAAWRGAAVRRGEQPVRGALSKSLGALEAAMQAHNSELERRNAAAGHVQRVYRGHLGRREARFVASLDAAASAIQRITRGHLARVLARELRREAGLRLATLAADAAGAASAAELSAIIKHELDKMALVVTQTTAITAEQAPCSPMTDAITREDVGRTIKQTAAATTIQRAVRAASSRRSVAGNLPARDVPLGDVFVAERQYALRLLQSHFAPIATSYLAFQTRRRGLAEILDASVLHERLYASCVIQRWFRASLRRTKVPVLQDGLIAHHTVCRAVAHATQLRALEYATHECAAAAANVAIDRACLRSHDDVTQEIVYAAVMIQAVGRGHTLRASLLTQ